MTDNSSILPNSIAKEIVCFKGKKWQEENLSNLYPNKILRGDVLEILEKYCTVIYYPLPNERNNGFQLNGIPDKRGNEHHFVFINSNQTIEKQVFTAAHELGHIWNIDEHIGNSFDLDLTEELREKIINRFAAELLIPEDEFNQAVNDFLVERIYETGKISFLNLSKLIASLMNFFLVPKTAVIMRLEETNYLSHDSVNILLGRSSNKDYKKIEEAMSDAISRTIKEEGYIELQKGNGKKWVSGLADLLDKAETNHTVSQSKIDHMRNLFDLARYNKIQELDQPIEIGKKEKE